MTDHTHTRGPLLTDEQCIDYIIKEVPGMTRQAARQFLKTAQDNGDVAYMTLAVEPMTEYPKDN